MAEMKITVSFMREVLAMLQREEISFSRMVEMINERGNEPGWLSGNVQCAVCTHTWVAVRPVGTNNLECPHCGNFSDVIVEN